MAHPLRKDSFDLLPFFTLSLFGPYSLMKEAYKSVNHFEKIRTQDNKKWKQGWNQKKERWMSRDSNNDFSLLYTDPSFKFFRWINLLVFYKCTRVLHMLSKEFHQTISWIKVFLFIDVRRNLCMLSNIEIHEYMMQIIAFADS